MGCIARLIRSFVSILLVVACLLSGILWNLRADRKSAELVEMLTADAESWEIFLDESITGGAADTESAEELISGYGRLVQEVEYISEYSGIYLVMHHMFPTKDGLLLSYEEIEAVPMEQNTGECIEALPADTEFSIYRLQYYWD